MTTTYTLSPVETGQVRMWNGSSKLRFTVRGARAGGMRKISYHGGSDAFSTEQELYEASHVVDLPGARARQLATERMREARKLGLTGAATFEHAADTLARLCAVYAGGETDRCWREARAYALAFRMVETSRRRLALRAALTRAGL